MSALPALELVADTTDYYEVRDLLSGEIIGRISGGRVRGDGALRRALEQHGFRLVPIREHDQRPRRVFASAA